MEATKILSDTEWSVAVRRRLGDEAVFKVLEVTGGPLSHQLIGFVGEHLRAQVTIQLPNNERDILKFFVKRVPKGNEFQNTYVVSTDSFPKESGFYSRVVEHFRRVCVPEQPPWAGECYFTRPDLLVMEDLNEKGFTLFDKFQYLDYNHCAMVMRTLANLHACSIILEENEGELYKLKEEYSDLLFENLFINSGKSLTQHWFSSSIKAMKALLPFIPKYGTDEELHHVVLEKISGTAEKVLSLMEPSDKYRNVICHGDVWCNNMLFRYGKASKVPEDARLVDFQMYRYAPPATDVSCFMHFTTSRTFRMLHEDDLLTLYHESLAKELKRNGYEVDRLLPWQQFLESYRHYKTLGRIIAPIYLHLDVLPDEDLTSGIKGPDGYQMFLLQDRDKEVLHALNTNAVYRSRIVAAMEEMIECEILQQ